MEEMEVSDEGRALETGDFRWERGRGSLRGGGAGTWQRYPNMPCSGLCSLRMVFPGKKKHLRLWRRAHLL